MALQTGDNYLASIKKLDHHVFIQGEKIQDVTSHPLARPPAMAMAETFFQAEQDEMKSLFTAQSHLTGDTVNRFTHIQQSREDLVNKILMLREMGRETACCFQRCAGLDCINTLYAITYETDQEFGTHYHGRFNDFMRYIQSNDLVSRRKISFITHVAVFPDSLEPVVVKPYKLDISQFGPNVRDRIEFGHPLLPFFGPFVLHRLKHLFEFRHRKTAEELNKEMSSQKEKNRAVVLTGATGLIGRRIAQILVEKGYRVVALTRNVERAREMLGNGITPVFWDFDRPEEDEWQRHLEGARGVIHLAGTPLFDKRWTAAFKKKMEESRVLSTGKKADQQRTRAMASMVLRMVVLTDSRLYNLVWGVNAISS